MEASRCTDQLQAKTKELKKKLIEVEAKAKEEPAESSSQMEDMLYRCWAFN